MAEIIEVQAARIQMIDGTVWEMYGDQAKQVFEGIQQKDNRFLIIKKGRNQTFIPMQNILYVEFAMKTLRDKIEQKIEEKWEQLFSMVNHSYDEEMLENLEWCAEEDRTYVRFEGGGWQIISHDPQMARLMFEIEALNQQLEHLDQDESSKPK